jgi:hypothetical protein
MAANRPTPWRMFRPVFGRLAPAVLAIAASGAPAPAQNGTVAFSGHVSRDAPLAIVAFANEALLPLAGIEGKPAIRDISGRKVPLRLVEFRGRHAWVALQGANRQVFAACTPSGCRRYEVIRAGN